MRLDFSNFWQLQTLFYSLGTGVLLCLSYDIIRFINRLIRPGAIVIFIMDIIYWTYAAAITFSFFVLFSKGVVRFYAYIGFFIGFLLSRITISKLFMLLLTRLNKLVNFLKKQLLKPIRFISKKVNVASVKFCKILLNLKNKIKKEEKT